MVRRRVEVGAVCLAVLGLGLGLAGCGGSDGSAVTDGSAAAADVRPALREPARPQRLDRDSVLEGCSNAADDLASLREVTVVLPLDYEAGYDGMTYDPEGPSDPEEDVTCTLAALDDDDFPAGGRDVYVLTTVTRQGLAEAAGRRAVGGEPVVEPVTMLGEAGERATFRGRDLRYGSDYDVTAVQAGDLRLSRWAPIDRTPEQDAAGRRAWQAVQDSLAVRAPAADDGDADADAESDDEAGPDDTGAPSRSRPPTRPAPGPASGPRRAPRRAMRPSR